MSTAHAVGCGGDAAGRSRTIRGWGNKKAPAVVRTRWGRFRPKLPGREATGHGQPCTRERHGQSILRCVARHRPTQKSRKDAVGRSARHPGFYVLSLPVRDVDCHHGQFTAQGRRCAGSRTTPAWRSTPATTPLAREYLCKDSAPAAVKLANRTRSVVEENLGENGHRYNAQSVRAMLRGPQKRERGNR
jgi:hypothetical protein